MTCNLKRLSILAQVSLLLVAVMLLPGCLSEVIAHKLTDRPEQPSTVTADPSIVNQTMTFEVGPPKATLYAWVIEPRPHYVKTITDPKVAGFRIPETLPRYSDWSDRTIIMKLPDLRDKSVQFVVSPAAFKGQPLACRSTVLLFQGWGGGVRKTAYLLPLAAALSNAGYRVVCLDLRGQGDSTGEHPTYGKLETKDISQVIDNLQSRGMATQHVIAMGHSYGAATALAAGADPRVTAIVSLSPPDSLRNYLPSIRGEAKITDPVLAFFLDPWVDDAVWQKAVTRAGELADFDPAQADPSLFIKRTRAPVLMAHGTKDQCCLFNSSQKLVAARPANTILLTYDGDDHWSYLPREEFRKAVLDWLDKRTDRPAPQTAPATQPTTKAATTTQRR